MKLLAAESFATDVSALRYSVRDQRRFLPWTPNGLLAGP